MNPTTSKFAALMGSASLLTLTNVLAAQAQQVAQAQMAQAQEVPEQVLITGSLIHGTAAVGVPVTNLSVQDFKTTGAKYEDTENLIDQSRRIATVEVASLFVELKDGRVRCSLRSRGAVDVCKIAQKFNGGGHPSAAGAYLPGPIDNAKKLILDAVKSSLT
jgi:nanoRNase/pAp phosphatase (c-di-AMP/oligoRNAs hydrolase)